MDSYTRVEKEFLKKFSSLKDLRFPEKSPLGHIYKQLFEKTREIANKEGLYTEQYEEKLCEASSIIEDIVTALNYWNNSEDKDMTLLKISEHDLIEKPQHWSDVSPIDSASLDAATAKYLKESWMQLDILDWYILNGFIIDSLIRSAEEVKSGSAYGKTNWAYSLAGGNMFKTLLYRAGFEITRGLLRWILFPVIIALLYFSHHEEYALWTAIPYLIYLLMHIVMWPRRFARKRELKKQISKSQERLAKIETIYNNVFVNTINPTHLKELIQEAEASGINLKPAVHTILDRAIKRDPTALLRQ